MGLYQLRLRPRRGLWPRLRPGSPEFSAVVARGGRGAAAAPCAQPRRPLPRCAALEGDAVVDCDAMLEGDGGYLKALHRRGQAHEQLRDHLDLAMKDYTRPLTRWTKPGRWRLALTLCSYTFCAAFLSLFAHVFLDKGPACYG